MFGKQFKQEKSSSWMQKKNTLNNFIKSKKNRYNLNTKLNTKKNEKK